MLSANRKEAKPAPKTRIPLSNEAQSQTTKPVVTVAKANITVPKDVVSAVKKKTIKSKMIRKLKSFSVDLTHHSVALPSINDGLFFVPSIAEHTIDVAGARRNRISKIISKLVGFV